MSKANQFRTYLVAGVACLSLLASCSTDEDDGTMLPDGKYPMTFATSVEGLAVTRAATADGQWTTGDPIAVQVGGDVKQYTPTTTGNNSATLSAASGTTPFYWQNTNSISVTAWYYGTGYNATSPGGASWAVQSDQNASNGTGYQHSDFLYAPATDISFSGRSTTSLSFYHQTARVVVNIVNAEAATDASTIQRVVIGDANNLALSGSYTAPTGGGATAGTWNTSSGSPTMGTITPKKLTTPGTLAGGETALASYTALVIPQQMKEKKFIVVTLTDGSSGSNTYYYTPTQDSDANLQSGKQHTYDITVKHGYLSVTSFASPQWTGSGETITGNGQTVTPGTDGNGSGWTQDGNDEPINGTERSNNP